MSNTYKPHGTAARAAAILVPLFSFAALIVGCIPTSVTTTTRVEGVIVELWVSNRCPRVGERVTLRATVSNQSTRRLRFDLEDQVVLDIIIGNPDSSPTRWSSNKAISPEPTMLELEPGKSKSIEMDWQITESSTVVSASLIEGPTAADEHIRPLLVLNTGGCGIIAKQKRADPPRNIFNLPPIDFVVHPFYTIPVLP